MSGSRSYRFHVSSHGSHFIPGAGFALATGSMKFLGGILPCVNLMFIVL